MSNKKLTVTFDRKTIALIIAGVAAILCFIGLFGNMLTSNLYAKVGSQTGSEKLIDFNLAWIFKDGWDYIKNTFTEVGGFGTGIQKFGLVLMIISFFAACGGILFAIGKSIYSYIKKGKINFKFDLSILLVAAAQYLFMSRYVLAYTTMKITQKETASISTVYVMGWGAILITIGFFLALIALIVHEADSKEAILNKKSVCLKSAVIGAFFVGLYGLTNISQISVENTIETQVGGFNIFDWISYIQVLNGQKVVTDGSANGLAVVALIFGLISVIAFFTALFTYMNAGENKLDKRLSIISSITFLASTVISNIFILVSAYKLFENATVLGTLGINVGFTFIVGLVLGVALMVLSIVAYKDKKVKA